MILTLNARQSTDDTRDWKPRVSVRGVYLSDTLAARSIAVLV
jgi:hypothetical protein